MKSEFYTVGYMKPPEHSRFRKGQSGNPKGRPKRTMNLVDRILEEMMKPVTVRCGGELKKITYYQAIIQKAIIQAANGNPRDRKFLFETLEETEIFKRPEFHGNGAMQRRSTLIDEILEIIESYKRKGLNDIDRLLEGKIDGCYVDWVREKLHEEGRLTPDEEHLYRIKKYGTPKGDDE